MSTLLDLLIMAIAIGIILGGTIFIMVVLPFVFAS